MGLMDYVMRCDGVIKGGLLLLGYLGEKIVSRLPARI